MIQTFALLYGISAIALIIGGLPQVIQVLRTKNVEGISLETYDMWLIFQLLSMPYVIQSGDMLWMSANGLWALYYATMIVLIEHYRYPHYIRVLVDKFVKVIRVLPAHAKS